jgi:hypothetical protein
VYTNDPFEVVRPFKPQAKPKIDPRFLAFGQEAQGAGRGHTVGKPEKGFQAGRVCYYRDGRHACYDYRDYCPVNDAEARVYATDTEQPIVFRPARPRT